MTDDAARRVLAIREADETDETTKALDGNGEPSLSDVSPRYIRELARLETYASIATICELRDNPDVPPNTRLASAKYLLERGWGNPASEAEMLKVFLERNVADNVIEFVMPMNTDGATLAQPETRRTPSKRADPST